MALEAPIIVPAIRLDQDAEAETKLALGRAKEPWVAGFILFGGEAEQVAKLTVDLRHEAGRPIFIASDMERGAGQQIKGLTQLPDAGLVGLAGTVDEAKSLGVITAQEARSVGINVIFAPCVDVRSDMDNPILGNRSFGYDPHRVAALGLAFADGIYLGGATAVAKHFPGHGATATDSHDAMPVIRCSSAEMRARDLVPFERMITVDTSCRAVMAAHISCPALDPSGAIATFSAPMLGLIKEMTHCETCIEPVVFTDALLMTAATTPGGEPEAALRAIAAGCNFLLYPKDPEAVAAGLADAGEEFSAQLRRAHEKADEFVANAETVADMTAELFPDFRPDAAERIAERAVRMALGTRLERRPEHIVVIDDDGIEDRGAVLEERGRRAGDITVHVLHVPDSDPGEPAGWPDPPPPGYWCFIVIASARAWKGAAGVSPKGLEAVRYLRDRAEKSTGVPGAIIWCTPRPESAEGAHLPGSGPHLENALADLIWDVRARIEVVDSPLTKDA